MVLEFVCKGLILACLQLGCFELFLLVFMVGELKQFERNIVLNKMNLYFIKFYC